MVEVHYEKIFFTGHVQGVGFRYSTLQVALEYEVAGVVMNLTDGRVQIEVEGLKREVDQFILAVEERMHGHVRKTERLPARRVAQFQGFAIK